MATISPALPHPRTPSWRGVALAAGLGLSLAAPAEPRETWGGPAHASLPRTPLAAQRPAPWPGFEVEFRLPATGRHPDDVRVEARFTSPCCEPVRVGGFADLPAGHYRLEWVDDVTGASLGVSDVEPTAC